MIEISQMVDVLSPIERTYRRQRQGEPELVRRLGEELLAPSEMRQTMDGLYYFAQVRHNRRFK